MKACEKGHLVSVKYLTFNNCGSIKSKPLECPPAEAAKGEFSLPDYASLLTSSGL